MGTIYFDKHAKKWVGQVKRKGIKSFSMSFDTEQEARDCVFEVEAKIKPSLNNIRKNNKVLKILGDANESN